MQSNLDKQRAFVPSSTPVLGRLGGHHASGDGQGQGFHRGEAMQGQGMWQASTRSIPSRRPTAQAQAPCPQDVVDKVSFLMLGLDLPAAPLFKDALETVIIPQVRS